MPLSTGAVLLVLHQTVTVQGALKQHPAVTALAVPLLLLSQLGDGSKSVGVLCQLALLQQ